MAYGIGSILGDIDQKADAYRNNPDALAQSYQQNQQLIDLLVLQKLKTDKEAAQRDMQAKMQTPASTIKDQRQEQVMGMTRNEVAQQVTPGLQALGQQMQAAQAQGISSLPAPNMQQIGMAEGGIVGYSGGGNVTKPRQYVGPYPPSSRGAQPPARYDVQFNNDFIQTFTTPTGQRLTRDDLVVMRRDGKIPQEMLLTDSSGQRMTVSDAIANPMSRSNQVDLTEEGVSRREAFYQLPSGKREVTRSSQPVAASEQPEQPEKSGVWDRYLENAGDVALAEGKGGLDSVTDEMFGVMEGIAGPNMTEKMRTGINEILPTRSRVGGFSNGTAHDRGAMIREWFGSPVAVAANTIGNVLPNIDMAAVRDFGAGVIGAPAGTRGEATTKTPATMGPENEDLIYGASLARRDEPSAGQPSPTNKRVKEAEEGYLAAMDKRGIPSALPTTTEETKTKAILSTPTEAIKRAPSEAQQSYAKQLADLRMEQESKLESLIAFLKGAGGQSSFAATMMGGSDAMNAREAGVKAEIMDVLGKLETIDLKERELGIAEEANVIDREQIQATLDAARYNTDRDYAAAMAQIDADIANAKNSNDLLRAATLLNNTRKSLQDSTEFADAVTKQILFGQIAQIDARLEAVYQQAGIAPVTSVAPTGNEIDADTQAALDQYK